MFKLSAIIFIAALLLTGCLTTSTPEDNIRVELLFEVEQLGKTFERGEESIRINEFKFAIDTFNLIAEDSLVLGSSKQIDSMIFFYTNDLTNKNLVLSVDLGFQDVEIFEGYEMFLRPVKQMDNISDEDFFGSDKNYSIIAKGEYNGEPFSFNSSLSMDRSEDFGAVQVNQEKETLVIDKSLLISNVFIDDSNQIIDPTDPDNISLINSLFEDNLTIEGYSVTRRVDLE